MSTTSMEMEGQVNLQHQQALKNKDKKKKNTLLKRSLLLLNCVVLAIGTTGGPLLLRLYFVHGGKRIWLSSSLETAGWPLMLLPLFISYLNRRNKASQAAKLFFITPRLFMASAALGILTGLDDYLYAYGVSRLPVSTIALITASHLAFTAGFAFLIVKQRFTFYSINSVVLLTVGAVVLGIHTSGDRPDGQSNKEYFLGFFMTLASSALYGFVLPMVELTYKKANQSISYSLVMEMQLVISAFATAFCTIGMLVNHDFQAIPREARTYALGEVKYYMVLVWNAIIWQFFYLGAIGVISCASSLLSGIIIALLLPVTETLGVIIYHDKFTPEKGISLALSIWGFVSYFYGELKRSRKKNQKPESGTPIPSNIAQS